MGQTRTMRPRDVNALTVAIVSEATDEDREPEDPYDGKNPAAVELGRQGGLKGGRARAEKLTPEQRSEIAPQSRSGTVAEVVACHCPECLPEHGMLAPAGSLREA